ncbi:MAG: DotU family type IV/VI secretion system protein [Acidobacteriota bacterium]
MTPTMPSPRRASKPTPQPSILVGQFAAFYKRLQQLADRLRRGTSDADDARTDLVSFFEQQENAVRPLGAGFLRDTAAPARRAMAVLADQWLGYQLEWSGRAAWAAAPLAARLFDDAPGDTVARVAHDVETLLDATDAEPAQRALARVYLEALGLGLSRPFAADEIPRLKNRLFAFLYPQHPDPADTELLFPEAYGHTTTGGDRALLPTPAPWWRVLAVAGLLLLIISWPVWRDATERLRDALDRVPAEVATTAPEPGADR